MKKFLYSALISVSTFSLYSAEELSSQKLTQQPVDRFAAQKAATVAAPSGSLSAVKASSGLRSSLTAGQASLSSPSQAASAECSRVERKMASSGHPWGATVSAPSGSLFAVKATPEQRSSLTAGLAALSSFAPTKATSSNCDFSRIERRESPSIVAPVQLQPTKVVNHTTYVTQPVVQPVVEKSYYYPTTTVIREQVPASVYVHHTHATPQKVVHVVHSTHQDSLSSGVSPRLPSWLTFERVIFAGAVVVGSYCLWRLYLNKKHSESAFSVDNLNMRSL